MALTGHSLLPDHLRWTYSPRSVFDLLMECKLVLIPLYTVPGWMEPVVEGDGTVNSLTLRKPKNAREKAADSIRLSLLLND